MLRISDSAHEIAICDYLLDSAGALHFDRRGAGDCMRYQISGTVMQTVSHASSGHLSD
jgi:hypothetical protein